MNIAKMAARIRISGGIGRLPRFPGFLFWVVCCWAVPVFWFVCVVFVAGFLVLSSGGFGFSVGGDFWLVSISSFIVFMSRFALPFVILSSVMLKS